MGRKSIEKNRKEIDKKVDDWLRNLLPLLQNEPLQKLSINKLAKLMGKSKSTVYEYFTSKEEILLKTARLLIDDLKQLIFDPIIKQETKSVTESYTNFMSALCNTLSGISLSFLNDLKNHYPTVWAEVDLFIEDLLFHISEIYKKGIKQKEFRKYSVDLMLMMDRFFVSQVVTNASTLDNKLTVDVLIKEYLELRLNGLET